MLISLQNISKNYSDKNNKQSKNALSNINLSFPESGLVSIVGKSGSGKSSLLNIIGLIDKPTSGKYYFDNSDTTFWKKNRISDFHNFDVGIVFQNYQLLEDLTVLENVVLPQLIGGKRKNEATNYALTMLSSIGFSKEMSKNKVANLSGGEKQRVAILRAIINDPKVLLCDEPTGALDSSNSELVMEMLSKISKKVLVIVVSHNMTLVDKYSDRIITIKDGEIDSDEQLKENESVNHKNKKTKHSNNWVDCIAVSNINRRKRRNIVSLVALSFSLIASTMVLGFIKGSSVSIANEGTKHLDYGVMTVSKETTTEVNNTFVSLVKQTRPTKKELQALKKKYPNFYFELNYDALVSPYQNIKITNQVSESMSFMPVYSFNKGNVNTTLLLEGRLPTIDSFYEVVVNKKAADILSGHFNTSCIDKTIRLKNEYKYTTYTLNETNDIIDDYLIIDKKLSIVGIVDELNFLSSPTIYYSFKSLDQYLSLTPMNNLSSFYGYNYTWKDLVQYASDNSAVTSYSYRTFINYIDTTNLINTINDEEYTFASNAIEVGNALSNIIDASKIGVEIFLFITILGTLLIIGIISFSSYSDDVRRSAILSSIGARNSEIASLYVVENTVVGLVALLVTFALSPPLIMLVNLILNNVVGISTLVVMPINLIDKIPYSYYLVFLVVLIVVVLISTSIPLLFSKKFSIREEMQQE